MSIAAKYEHGVFKPLSRVDIEEGTLVEVRLLERSDRPSVSIEDFAFFGLWKDRTDLGDSVDFVNDLRSRLRR
jgi:hypothetical protein